MTHQKAEYIMFEIFKRFFLLGWVSFGGPAAHIGYFRNEFVQKRGWISEEEYAQLIALSQFLPGPGSSQVGFALGYHRKGLFGALLASIGFTLPSILIMVLLANISHSFFGNDIFEGIIHGLKLLAVVVVADAIMGMYKSFCKDKITVLLCIMTASLLLILPSISTQLIALLIAAIVGRVYLKSDQSTEVKKESKGINWIPLVIFGLCFFALPAIVNHSPLLVLFSDFFQAGSLVFGGGHVVLPLLQNIVGDQISTDSFLTGYAAAQAVPGPMFTFATFLGYELWSEQPVLGALIATVAIFLPGFLLVLGVFSHWQVLAQKPALAGAITGINAAVVGLLIAALYDPVFTSAVGSGLDMALVIVGFALLKVVKLPIVGLVSFFIVTGGIIPFIS